LENQKLQKEMEELEKSFHQSTIEVEDEYRVKLEEKEREEEKYKQPLQQYENEKNKLIAELNSIRDEKEKKHKNILHLMKYLKMKNKN
jgi:hypothetical protein